MSKVLPSDFQGLSAKYKVTYDPSTQKEIVITAGGKDSTATLPVYFYTGPKGLTEYVNDPQAAAEAYLKDINANGTKNEIALQLFNKGYLTKKEYTTGSPSSFIEGLVKNIRDYSVDQVIKMSNNEQTDFVPFFTWSKSTAGKSANTGQSGNTSQSTTNKNKSSQISTNVDLKLTDSQQAALDINAFFFDAIKT